MRVDCQTIKVATRARSPIGELSRLAGGAWKSCELYQQARPRVGKELRAQSNQHSRGLVERLEELRTLSTMPDCLAARSVGR